MPLQTDFIVASRQAERRRLRTTIAVTVTTLIVTVVLAVAAVFQWREAVSQRNQAQSRALAAAAMSQLDVDPERSLLLARAAWSRAPTDEAVAALRTSVDRSRIRAWTTAHSDAVSGVAWSPDGATVISAGRDGSVAAWEAATGAPRGRLVLGQAAVTSLSVAAEASVGVAADDRGQAMLWELDHDTGMITSRAQLASSGVTAVVISADGRVVAAGMADGTVRLWDASGTEAATVRWSASSVESLALSADGGTLLLGTQDGTVMVGPAQASTPVRSVRHSAAVFATQLNSGGSVMLTASQDGAVSWLRVSDGAELTRSPVPAFLAVMDPAGSHLLVGNVDGGVYLLAAGGAQTTLATRGPIGITAGFTPDGSLAQIGRTDGVSRIWRVSDQEPVVDLRGGPAIQRAALSPDGLRLVSGTGDGVIRVWALPDRPLILPASSEPGVTGDATSVTFTAAGDELLTAAQGGPVRAWDASSAAETPLGAACTTPPLGALCLGLNVATEQGGWITRARYSPDGTLIATSGQNGTAVVWNAESADEVARAPQINAPIDDLAFSADGQLLALGDRSGRTRLLEPRTGEVRAELKGGDAAVYAVAFTPDGHLLTGDETGVVRLWNIPNGTNRVVGASLDAVFDLAVDDEGRMAAAASDSRIMLLDLRGGGPARTVTGQSGVVNGIAFAPGGAMLMSGGQDGTVRVWDVTNGQLATTFHVPGGDVSDIAVDHTGRRIAAVSNGGDGAVFDCEVCGSPEELVALAAQHTTRELTAEERITFTVP
ncbi:WD40 repeat [Geodermatophilus africanus]|uniref:WD40 repeat n=1 Tax=Geodermatophilus africanus TaxID=1137993 RepID=A0A1H3R1F2_9ACTN|nr:WD40 repeat domain-containing protein [Geodermatophilus africanus]SDZ19644.1 WD40 repeat [Geodermatophilus africanus]